MITKQDLAILRLQWHIQILQELVAKSYVAAFSALRTAGENPQSSQLSLEQLSQDLDRIKENLYPAFFVDPNLPEADRALLAEEFAHLIEEIHSSLIPPLGALDE